MVCFGFCSGWIELKLCIYYVSGLPLRYNPTPSFLFIGVLTAIKLRRIDLWLTGDISVEMLEAGIKTINMDAQKLLAWLKKGLESQRSTRFREELQKIPASFSRLL